MRSRNDAPRGWVKVHCLAKPEAGQSGSTAEARSRGLLHNVEAFGGRRKVELRFVDLKVDGNGVSHADAQAVIGRLNLDVLALGGNIQVLDSLENDVANLVVGV